VSDLVAFLAARLDEDEQWAIAASTDSKGVTVTGQHWRWEDAHSDKILTPDPVTQEFLDEETDASLRSIEHYPWGSIAGEGPAFLISHAQEVQAAAGGHIARHDPARVLREVDAKRKILAEHGDTVGSVWIPGHGHDNKFCMRCVDSDRDGDYYAEEPGPCLTLRTLAAVWSGHPDYDPDWA
jgi:Family of unknown function (DUF6221)